jgi:hypothetical protein
VGRVLITIVAIKNSTMRLSAAELHITVNNIKILMVAHKSFYDECLSLATIKRTQVIT